MGRFDEGSAYGEEAIRVAEPLGHALTLAGAYWFLAQLQITRGEFDHAIRLTERGLAVSDEGNVPLFSLSHTGSLGQAYACLGRTAEGIALIERALSAFEATGNAPLATNIAQVMLSEAYVLTSQLDDALA